MKYCLWFVLLAIVTGCTETSDTAGDPKPPGNENLPGLLPSAQPDNEDAVATLEALGAKLKRNGGGNILEVNLRETEATNDALLHVAALENVTSILLNDLPITDDGLAHLSGTTSPIANLDLRGCPVGNDGLAHLKGLKSLKALRLNGTSGLTTVVCRI